MLNLNTEFWTVCLGSAFCRFLSPCRFTSFAFSDRGGSCSGRESARLELPFNIQSTILYSTPQNVQIHNTSNAVLQKCHDVWPHLYDFWSIQTKYKTNLSYPELTYEQHCKSVRCNIIKKQYFPILHTACKSMCLWGTLQCIVGGIGKSTWSGRQSGSAVMSDLTRPVLTRITNPLTYPNLNHQWQHSIPSADTIWHEAFIFLGEFISGDHTVGETSIKSDGIVILQPLHCVISIELKARNLSVAT